MNEQEKFFWETCIEELQEVYEYIREKDENKANIMGELEFYNKSLGMLEWVFNNNLIEARKRFYIASMAREWYYMVFPTGKYEFSSMEVRTYAFESLFYAVLSGNKEWAIHMAELFGSYKELETQEHLANELLGYGLKYVILDDVERAKEYIQRIEASKNKKGMKQYSSGYARAYRGIVERNAEEFNAGLLFMLNNHAARMKRDGRGFDGRFAYDSVALAMIAKDRGIDITVEHELLPMSYLEKTDIDYSEIKLFEE